MLRSVATPIGFGRASNGSGAIIAKPDSIARRQERVKQSREQGHAISHVIAT
jgi:hypothetical protein